MQWGWTRTATLCAAVIAVPQLCRAQNIQEGRVVDPQGRSVAGATVQAIDHGRVIAEAATDPDGRFTLPKGDAQSIRTEAPGFAPILVRLPKSGELQLQFERLAGAASSVTVTADWKETDLLEPDPGEKVFVKQELLDASPGRPGVPVSIPGFPAETASGGIKAPQYFAPGVAGDHGEPIAQYLAVGGYLLPNNLSANAHGNGYADPNLLIPAVLASVAVDGGAFNVREGDHAVSLATIYGLRERLDPFVMLTADYRDLDLVAGMSPDAHSFAALEASFGNGLLHRLEHRQQYKINGQKELEAGPHQLTLVGIGYYGVSRVPGLVPVFTEDANDAGLPNYGDTIDPRQKDQTHTALAAADDRWRLSGRQQVELAGFFRTYNLSLFSDFGQGLIRQSEFRTVAGGKAEYQSRVSEQLSLLAGFEYDREAPRRDDLDRYDLPDPANLNAYGPFTRVDANNITIGSYTPYMAAAGVLGRYLRYYAGLRRAESEVGNRDLLNAQNSFHKLNGLNLPKASLSFQPQQAWFVPAISFSYGEAYFTEDPRIGVGTGAGSAVATARAYQLVFLKTVEGTDLKLTLGHLTASAELAKIDPDTGLQQDQGPSLNRFFTATVQRNFHDGSVLVTFSKADARDLQSGLPTPEAPRTIFDVLGGTNRLPWRLGAKAEFEYVGRKPLGTGCAPDPVVECTGTSVREFRGAMTRSFRDGGWEVGLNVSLAGGYTGQTTENFYPASAPEVVGVRAPSSVSLSVTRHVGRLPVTARRR